MAEGKSRTKLVLVVVIAAMAFPLYALSGSGMERWVQKCKENEGRDPKAAENLYKLALVYHWTYRTDKAKELLREWIIRYGGDDSEWGDGDKIFTWEPPHWTEDKPRPAFYSKTPHPLTAKVLCVYAEIWETERQVQVSRHLFEVVVKKFPDDKGSFKRASDGVLRDRGRSM